MNYFHERQLQSESHHHQKPDWTDEICPWIIELSVSGRELLYHCTAEEQTYRDRAATGRMALSKLVTPFLVSPA